MQSDWLHQAAQLPLAFAQVREDALVDLAVIEECTGRVRVLMVASGGCAAASLATSEKVAKLHLADFNPAQLALSRAKLHLLAHASPGERMEILGHAPLARAERARRWRELSEKLSIPPDTLGPEELIAEHGPDHLGRYEIVFAQLRRRLGDVADDLLELLAMHNPVEQTVSLAPGTALSGALDEALKETMSLPNLVGLFGTAATANPVKPFHQHFSDRIRHVLSTLPAAENPYLAQMLAGRFPPGHAYHWLQAPRPERMPEVACSCGRMNDILQAAAPESYEVIHLSNILDWLSPPAAAETLRLAARALVEDGVVIIRQLNSSLDIPGLASDFEWETNRAAALHHQDRSFFYRALHVGRRQGGK